MTKTEKFKIKQEIKKQEINLERAKITTADIRRNMDKISKGRPLDIPLYFIKTTYRNRFKDNKVFFDLMGKHERSGYITFNYYKRKGFRSLNIHVKKVLWFLYFYNKYLEKRRTSNEK